MQATRDEEVRSAHREGLCINARHQGKTEGRDYISEVHERRLRWFGHVNTIPSQ